MKVRISKITKKGQITIPVEIRKKLDINQNDFLAITAEKDYILIKKVEFPSWDEIFLKGEKFAKENHLSQEDIINACSDVRHSK